jgi:N utilization substance protein A
LPLEELAAIESFDEDVSRELRERAHAYLAEQSRELDKQRKEMGVSDEIAELPGLRPAMLVALGEKGVKTLDNLADLASDELLELLPESSLSEEDADAIIMAARAHWFTDENAAPKDDAEPEA